MEVVVARCDQNWSKSTTNLAFYLTVSSLPPFDVVLDEPEVVTLVAASKVPYSEVGHNNNKKGGS